MTLVKSAYNNSIRYLKNLPEVEFKTILYQSTYRGEPSSVYEITKKPHLRERRG
jgi:hypothetical protein